MERWMFGRKKGQAIGAAPGGGTAAATRASASGRPVPKPPPAASKGKQAYEARRAEKAGVGLEKWMADKERRTQAEREAEQRARRKALPSKKSGLLRRLLDRAHKPL